MNLRAVLFDLDDTLHDKSATLRAVAAKQYASGELSSFGIHESEWESLYVALNNLRIEKTEVFSRLRDQFSLPSGLVESLLADFDKNLGATAKPYVGALDLVRSCKAQGMKVGLVTNGRDAFQRSKIIGLGLGENLDALVTSGGLGIKKPDSRIFRACLQMLDVEPHTAAFVGDDFAADMQPALELGMQAIWKSAATSPRVAFSSDSLNEIRAFLLSAV
ncbi:HAD family hydrolase [Chitinolyticbacter albus]|uniref:HAD family hydrolase n=1 Tax=Chitinolyticbacter albus TaxID=2961951 RepID=UPI00210CEFA5|nr:HAD family hydrolase [Chitinolyticbacter albus]